MSALCARLGATQGEHCDAHPDCLLHLAEAWLDLGERAAADALLRELRGQVIPACPGSARRLARIDRLAVRAAAGGAPLAKEPDERPQG